MKRIIILACVLLFPFYVHAQVAHEGDGVVLEHFEETNVELPDHLKNMPSDTQDPMEDGYYIPEG